MISALLFGCFSGMAAHAEEKTAIAPMAWKDIQGKSYTQQSLNGAKANVFLFISTQCPIANRYTPRILALAKDYAPRGVRFFLVDSNGEDSLAIVKRYAAERKFPFPVVKDSGTALADRLGADTTPQAVILDSGGEKRYIGRIDDNQDPAKVGRHDVREALDALMAGKPVKQARTLAFGCLIFRDKPARSMSPIQVTYAREVAPILNANCVICHRTGEVAPFALETYKQARTWATAIKNYTARRLMPPWKPVQSAGPFHDQRRLSEAQIATLAAWAEAGAPSGNLAEAPPIPKFAPPMRWTLGTPDVELKPVRAYHLEPEGRDVYRNFVMPVDFQEDRYLEGIEFQPDNRAVVHHIVVYVDPKGESVPLDGKEKEPGYSTAGTGIGIQNATWGEVWVPGNAPRKLPSGVALHVPKGSKLVMQVHYHKTGKPEVDHSRMALYFAKGEVKQKIHMLDVGNLFFRLPAGAKRHEVQGRSLIGTLPVDAHLRSIFPHMHMLGKAMKVIATLPDGTIKTLITIDDWDFNWQATYFYKEPVALPKGTKITLTAVYDNSESNPRQTSHPPKEVRFGEQTTDEMCFAFLGVTIDAENLSIKTTASATSSPK